MRTAVIILSFLVLGLVIGWLIWFLAPQLLPVYTAETFIRVLPGTDKSSAVALLRHYNTLTSLVDRDKIQQTKWFQGLGKTKGERWINGAPDFKKHFCAKAIHGGDIIRVSMTCSNAVDAAVIVNEMADMFVQTQLNAKRKQIATKLTYLEENHVRLQRDLDLAGRALDDIRQRYGFTDLEEHSYPHPVTVRLIRLQNEEDNCTLDINQLQTHREVLMGQPQQILPSGKSDPNQTVEIKNIELKIKLAQSRLSRIREMREETQKKHEELDLARMQYSRSNGIRNERQAVLDSVKTKSEDLKILYDNPDVSGLQLVDLAPIPLRADVLPWQIPVPIAAGAGLLIGIICALLTGKTRKPKQQD
jgi:hypothetical protein